MLYGYFGQIMFMLPFILLSLWASSKVKGTFAKYSKMPLRSNLSGADAARVILDAAGVQGVSIRESKGLLSDHYNPVNRTVNLSTEVLQGRNVAAVGVAAHEVGHAIQHARAYGPMTARASLVPVVSLASSLTMPMIIGAVFFHMFYLIWVAVICFALAVLFHLVTLPVEFDASRRAIAILDQSGIAVGEELVGVRKTLSAAGFTYVASTLVALSQLIYWLLQLGVLGGDD